MTRAAVVRTAAVGTACALIGAGAGIAASSASTSPKPPRHIGVAPLLRGAYVERGPLAVAGGPPAGPPSGLAFAFPALGAAGPPVHAEAVVPNEKGGFDTVTMDRGSFSSLSGDQLTIAEGTRTATYKTVSLTVPTGARVERNGETAKLSDLRTGDTVAVMHGPSETVVTAFDAQHEPRLDVKVAPLRGAPRPPGAGYEASESLQAGAGS